MAYQGTSIVDYLKSIGQASDYTSRAGLASQQGITDYAGTAEQNTNLLSKLRAGTTAQTTTGPTVGGLIPGTSLKYEAEDIANLTDNAGTPNLPTVAGTQPDLTSAKGDIASFQGMLDNLQKQQDQARKDYDAQLKATQDQQKSLIDKITKRKPVSETREEIELKLGLKPAEYFAEREADLAGVQSLMEEYDKAVMAKDLALSREQERLAPMDVISGKMSRVERDANIRLNSQSAVINTKLGIMTAKEGNFNQAQQYVNQAVNEYVAEQQMVVDDFKMFYDINRDLLTDLKSDYKDIVDKSYDLALTELADKKNNMQQVLNWAVQYPEAAWPSDLSTLTPEQAASIAAGRPITSGLIGTTGADYNDRLEDEIKNLYNGMYGSEGAREKVISILQNEFPNLDVAGNIYSRIPDGYEKQIKGTTTEIPEAETSDNYDWDTWKLIALTTPFSPGARTARAYQQEAILAFAYASSGKQMSWAEAQQLASAYIPNSYDSNSSKINKLLSLEAAINAINSTAKQGSPEETQGKIAKQKLNSLKQELGIKPKDEWEYIPN